MKLPCLILPLAAAFMAAGSLLAAPAKPAVDVQLHRPCNLFEPSSPVVFQFSLKKFSPGQGEARAVVTDYDHREIVARTVPVSVDQKNPASFQVDLGLFPRGYYRMDLSVSLTDGQGARQEASTVTTFGVMEFVHRTAGEVRDGGYSFGMKWGGARFDDPGQVKDAMASLGLQWTRIVQNDAAGLLNGYPLNAVVKIERFPEELYDAERYGPIEEWQKKYGKGQWKLKTLPRKGPYQEWLRKDIATNVPPDQNVFEIWNEPWDKMSPEDFAQLSQWIAEVVLKERPHAVLGQNLTGSTSSFGYDARVARAGGLKGMKMVALHVYGFPEDRKWLRDYRTWINEQAGHEMELYVTEYGHHSAPAGPSQATEEGQAITVVRRSLLLYAEGAKALTPHWIGQTEKNPTFQEDWYGYIRANLQPKPGLIALANAARLVDGSTYLGDLWFGPELEALVFERSGVYTIAFLGSKNTPREIEVPIPSGTKVSLVDLMGREQSVTSDGHVRVGTGASPVFLIGADKALAAQADKALRPDRWPQPEKPPRTQRIARKLKTPITPDGQFEDWKDMTEISLFNVKVNPSDDCSGVGYLAWDDDFLYVGINVRDNELLNTRPLSKLYQQDSVELFVSTRPRDTDKGYAPTDYQFFLTPTSADGSPILAIVADQEAGKLASVEGARFFGGKTARGWAIEAAIPWKTFDGFKPSPGTSIALEMRVNDADTSHERFKIDPEDGNVAPSDPTVWSLLSLQD